MGERKISRSIVRFLSNRDMQNYIDCCKKECASYPEQNNLHFENVTDITIYIHSITPHTKKNGREEDFQEDCRIPFNENEGNYSLILWEKLNQTQAKKLNKN